MKKQGPGFEEFSPGQSPLSCEARVLDLVDLSSVLSCEQLRGSNGDATVWLQDFQGRLLLGSYHPVPPFSKTSWWSPWDLPPLEAGNCPLPGRVQLSLLQEASLD